MKDRTDERWFEGRRNDHITISRDQRANILRNLIRVVEDGRTIRADFLNSDKPSILHYIGRSQWVNENTGYVHDWDGGHICDRCGARLEPDFTASTLECARFKDEMPHIAMMGLCPNCEKTLAQQHEQDMRDGLIFDSSKRLFLEQRRQHPNDFEQWMWLDSRRVATTISDRM